MVTVDNLTYSIKEKILIDSICAHFESGKMHLILGPNGAGKSTLIKMISGELPPSKGDVLIEKLSLHKISLMEQARYRAVLSQHLDLIFPLSVQEVVLMGRYPHFEGKPAKHDIKICEDSLDFFNLNELKNRNYLTLSGGEKQRVQFARVFAQIWFPISGKSRILLLDEPLTFLDIYYQYDLMTKIKNFMLDNPDLTVIGVVHDINIAEKYADNVLLLKDKQLFKFGLPHDVLTKEHIWEVFKVRVKNCFEVL